MITHPDSMTPSLRTLAGWLGCLAIGIVPLSHAGLVFEEERIVHEATVAEESFRGEFRFVNQGESAVRIGQVRSTCGCTVPQLEKSVYEPGESGVIAAIFTYGQRTGRQQKTITVPTDAGTHHLFLEVAIPQKWTVEPRIQTWRRAGEPETKTITVRFESVQPSEVTLSSYPEDRFTAETDWQPEENTFAIAFTPTDLAADGVLRAHVRVTDAQGTADIPLYLRIY